MIDIDAIVLGDDPYLIAPLDNWMVKELIDEIRRLRHDNAEIVKNCFTYSDIEKVFHKIMEETRLSHS